MTAERSDEAKIVLFQNGFWTPYVPGQLLCSDDPTGAWPMVLTIAEFALLRGAPVVLCSCCQGVAKGVAVATSRGGAESAGRPE